MIEVGQIRKWCHTMGPGVGGVFLIIELPEDHPDDPSFVAGWVKYIQDGKECLDNIAWIEHNSEVICEAG